MESPERSRARAAAARLAAATLVVALAITAPASSRGHRVSDHLARSRSRGTKIPFDAAGTEVKIDGDLAEWGKPPDGWALLQQGLDKAEFGVAPHAGDAAAIKFLRGAGALYFGVRVVDASVLGAEPGDRQPEADSVVLTVDVRPTSAGPACDRALQVAVVMCRRARSPASSLAMPIANRSEDPAVGGRHRPPTDVTNPGAGSLFQ